MEAVGKELLVHGDVVGALKVEGRVVARDDLAGDIDVVHLGHARDTNENALGLHAGGVGAWHNRWVSERVCTDGCAAARAACAHVRCGVPVRADARCVPRPRCVHRKHAPKE